MSKLTLKHIEETLKKEGVGTKLFTSLLFTIVFVLSIVKMDNMIIRWLICAVSFYIVLYNITYVIIDYIDIKIDYWKQIIYKRVNNTYKELIKFRAEYNKKYIETVEFNEMFELLITSKDKHAVMIVCDFFKSYNRFSCKDKDNEFIISLFVYIYNISRLDEKYLLMHRNNNN